MLAALVLLLAPGLHGEVHRMSLQQAVQAALKQNPDIALARLDEEKARQGIRQARDPFAPRITVGSGLAYSSGFPMSVEGSAPSVIQANATQFLFNRQQSYIVAQAREDLRGATLSVAGKRDEVAYRATALYLDAERAARIAEIASKDADSLQKVLDSVRAQVQEGRALPLEEKQAAYNAANARALVERMQDDQETAETALAMALGLTAADRVRPALENRPAPALPDSVEAAVETAFSSNKDLRGIESQILSKELQARGERAARWPRADLIAQYSMLAKFNNYDQYFRTFQRNNGQVGVAFQFPMFTGPGISAQVAQTRAEVSRLKIQLTNTRNRLEADVQGAFRQARRTATAAELAKLDLDVAREQLSVALARMEEGRVPLREVEESRVRENEKWIAFYDAQYNLEKARWDLLRLTGELAASVEALR